MKDCLDSGFEIDEGLEPRLKQEDHQKKNTAEPGRQLLGTWENTRGAPCPEGDEDG